MLLGIAERHAKADEPIDITLGALTDEGPRNPVLDGGGHIGAT